MKYLDLSFPSPQENLACDEALLDAAEDGSGGEVLRFWESATYFAALGYSNRAADEIHLEECRKNLVSVLRRPSGGGAVLQGPGCMNYALILKIPDQGPLAHLMETNQHILKIHREALAPLLGDEIKIQGVSDLTLGALKFSGNAQRRKRAYLLFHGTFLYHFQLELIEKYLRLPSRQPAYRKQRGHRDFVTNISLSPALIKQALQNAWTASEPMDSIPGKKIFDLMAAQYSKQEWNFKF